LAEISTSPALGEAGVSEQAARNDEASETRAIRSRRAFTISPFAPGGLERGRPGEPKDTIEPESGFRASQVGLSEVLSRSLAKDVSIH
jgi:hypothetical protein